MNYEVYSVLSRNIGATESLSLRLCERVARDAISVDNRLRYRLNEEYFIKIRNLLDEALYPMRVLEFTGVYVIETNDECIFPTDRSYSSISVFVNNTNLKSIVLNHLLQECSAKESTFICDTLIEHGEWYNFEAKVLLGLYRQTQLDRVVTIRFLQENPIRNNEFLLIYWSSLLTGGEEENKIRLELVKSMITCPDDKPTTILSKYLKEYHQLFTEN